MNPVRVFRTRHPTDRVLAFLVIFLGGYRLLSSLTRKLVLSRMSVAQMGSVLLDVLECHRNVGNFLSFL
jgi:hypothetical protein